MSFVEEHLLGLIIMLVVTIGLGLWLISDGGPRTRRIPPPAAKPVEPVAEAPPEPTPPAEPAPAIIAATTAAPVAFVDTTPVKAPAAKKPATARLAPAPAGPDNLLLLKGVGPKLVVLLNGLGITRFAEIAAWTEADIVRVDAQLGTFRGRITRDLWIEQAGYLVAGDIKSFEAKFGKLDGAR